MYRAFCRILLYLSKKCRKYISIKIIDAQQNGVLKKTDIVYIYCAFVGQF